MSKKIVTYLVLGCFLISGCATTGPVKGAAASDIIYTNAPKDSAFKSSYLALQKLGYKIELLDKDNFFIKGSYENPLTGVYPLYAKIEIDEEAGGTKITYSVDQQGTIKALDITGYYPKCVNNIYKAIADKLGEQGYVLQKK